MLVTTTTHIFRPQDEFLAMNEKQLQEIWAAGHWAVIGATEEKDPQNAEIVCGNRVRASQQMRSSCGVHHRRM